MAMETTVCVLCIVIWFVTLSGGKEGDHIWCKLSMPGVTPPTSITSPAFPLLYPPSLCSSHPANSPPSLGLLCPAAMCHTYALSPAAVWKSTAMHTSGLSFMMAVEHNPVSEQQFWKQITAIGLGCYPLYGPYLKKERLWQLKLCICLACSTGIAWHSEEFGKWIQLALCN